MSRIADNSSKLSEHLTALSGQGMLTNQHDSCNLLQFILHFKFSCLCHVRRQYETAARDKIHLPQTNNLFAFRKKTWFVIYGPSGDRDRKNHCRYQNLCWWANLMKTSGLILYSSDPVRDAEWVSSGPLAPTVPPDPPPPPAPHIQMMVWLMKSGSLTRSKVGFNRELATISRTNIRMGDAVKSSWKIHTVRVQTAFSGKPQKQKFQFDWKLAYLTVHLQTVFQIKHVFNSIYKILTPLLCIKKFSMTYFVK